VGCNASKRRRRRLKTYQLKNEANKKYIQNSLCNSFPICLVNKFLEWHRDSINIKEDDKRLKQKLK